MVGLIIVGRPPVIDDELRELGEPVTVDLALDTSLVVALLKLDISFITCAIDSGLNDGAVVFDVLELEVLLFIDDIPPFRPVLVAACGEDLEDCDEDFGGNRGTMVSLSADFVRLGIGCCD